MTASRWYAVHTNARAEMLAAQFLMRQGFEVFYPHFDGTIRHARKVIGVKKPLFSRYVFAVVDDGHLISMINTTPGVSTTVYTGRANRDFVAMPPRDVHLLDELRERADATGRLTIPVGPTETGIKPGDLVRIRRHVFEGRFGHIVEVEERGRVRVEIHAFGRLVPVIIETDAVELVEVAELTAGRVS